MTNLARYEMKGRRKEPDAHSGSEKRNTKGQLLPELHPTHVGANTLTGSQNTTLFLLVNHITIRNGVLALGWRFAVGAKSEP